MADDKEHWRLGLVASQLRKGRLGISLHCLVSSNDFFSVGQLHAIGGRILLKGGVDSLLVGIPDVLYSLLPHKGQRSVTRGGLRIISIHIWPPPSISVCPTNINLFINSSPRREVLSTPFYRWPAKAERLSDVPKEPGIDPRSFKPQFSFLTTR